MTDTPGRQRPERILVVGAGAREHALVWGMTRSPGAPVEILAAPGNPGIAALATIVGIPATDVVSITDWAAANEVDLVVVGPEAPLALGLADLLAERGIPVFGPSRAAAEIESSKVFAKEFMRRHGIPTAPFAVFAELDAALAFARQAAYPLVVKADGLAAGKGVRVCGDFAEAEAALRDALVAGAFGAAGERVVVEEFLAGEELSVIALVDGERIAILPLARDYKRLRDGNEGPNTGGMGSYAPVDDLAPLVRERVRETILAPAVAGLRAEGRPFRGALYAGLMLTVDGPMALEFNCRFGDPETQVIVPLLDLDLPGLLFACATGQLDPDAIGAGPGATVCVVLAAAGYPENPRKGDPISGIAAAEATGALVFHAGTALREGQLVTDGGRVLSVIATAEDLATAAARAYAAVETIDFPGKQLRGDIAQRSVGISPGDDVSPVRGLRHAV